MKDFSIAVEIQSPPHRVWTVLADVESWPEWTDSMTSVRRIDPEPFKVGSQVRISQPKLLSAIWQVTELDEGKTFTWETRKPGVRTTGLHCVQEVGTGTRVTLSLQFSGLLGPLYARLLGSLSRKYLAMEAEGLRLCCEGHS